MQRGGSLDMVAINPKKLNLSEFGEIHELTQDMWADSSSKLIICQSCHTISGKKEVFGHLPVDLYRQKVCTLFNRESPLLCPSCRGNHTDLMHPRGASIDTIRDRLVTSIESHSVLCRERKNGELVGYAEAYVAKFEDAYRWELAPHYPSIVVSDMRKRVESVLSRDVSTIIVFSVLGLMMEYRNPFIFAELLKQFFNSVSFDHHDSPALMEIGHNNSIYKVFMGLGGVSLNASDPSYFARHLAASPKYDSTIALFPISLPLFQKQFTKGSVREILQIV